MRASLTVTVNSNGQYFWIDTKAIEFKGGNVAIDYAFFFY